MKIKDIKIMGLSCSIIETDILNATLNGKSYKEIADIRGVSEQAIKECMKRFFKKNNLKNKESLYLYLLNKSKVKDKLIKQLLKQL